MIDTLVNKFKDLWYGQKKIEIEGHVIQKDIENKKSLVLIKIHNRVWKSTWLKDNEYVYKTPTQTLSSIFINK